MRNYPTLVLRRIRLLRTPSWRRNLPKWVSTNITPRLASERGDAHLREVLDHITPRLS
ncbi:MAG: hypothetical protein QOJ98_2207, partial [Acidobacteriota bacterium]|nr:hypothetical protein [Acidobacteriota bacterium]